MAREGSDEDFTEKLVENTKKAEEAKNEEIGASFKKVIEGNDNDFIAKLVEDTKKAEEEQYQGAFKTDGTINWECPCIQRDVVGPCGVEFRNTFTAYANMRTENAQQTSDEFMKAYSDFNTCSKKYPEYYYTSQKEEENEEDLDIENLDVVPDELIDEGGENKDENESAKTEAS